MRERAIRAQHGAVCEKAECFWGAGSRYAPTHTPHPTAWDGAKHLIPRRDIAAGDFSFKSLQKFTRRGVSRAPPVRKVPCRKAIKRRRASPSNSFRPKRKSWRSKRWRQRQRERWQNARQERQGERCRELPQGQGQGQGQVEGQGPVLEVSLKAWRFAQLIRGAGVRDLLMLARFDDAWGEVLWLDVNSRTTYSVMPRSISWQFVFLLSRFHRKHRSSMRRTLQGRQ